MHKIVEQQTKKEATKRAGRKKGVMVVVATYTNTHTERETSPMLELVFARSDLREMSEGFLKAFRELHAEGMVDRRLAVMVL
jgi:hypothetical protein